MGGGGRRAEGGGRRAGRHSPVEGIGCIVRPDINDRNLDRFAVLPPYEPGERLGRGAVAAAGVGDQNQDSLLSPACEPLAHAAQRSEQRVQRVRRGGGGGGRAMRGGSGRATEEEEEREREQTHQF